MDQVKSNPLQGATDVPIQLNDPRWPSSEGWRKMQRRTTLGDGTRVCIALKGLAIELWLTIAFCT